MFKLVSPLHTTICMGQADSALLNGGADRPAEAKNRLLKNGTLSGRKESRSRGKMRDEEG